MDCGKRARCLAFGDIGVPTKALCRIANNIREHGVPNANADVTEQDFARALQQEYGDVLRTVTLFLACLHFVCVSRIKDRSVFATRNHR